MRHGGIMGKSRRQFLAQTSLGILGAAVGCHQEASKPSSQPPGSPSAFGTSPAVGPVVSASTFAEAEKLMRIELTEGERSQIAGNWREAMAGLYERRTGPKKVSFESTLAPASRWNPVLPGMSLVSGQNRFVRSSVDPGPLPTNDADIAFASVTHLSHWIEKRQISSER